jgi:hypothetical protein
LVAFSWQKLVAVLTPNIVVPVVEEDAAKVPSADGQEVEIPINISGPNPNGTEFDNLYLDMNGIVSVSALRGLPDAQLHARFIRVLTPKARYDAPLLSKPLGCLPGD